MPAEVWEAANHLLDERRHRPSIRPSKRTVHPFAGYIFCHCGQKMYVPSKSVKYTCATCRTKIPTADLEAVFRERLREFALSPEEVAGHLAQGDAVIGEKRDLLASLERERAKVAGEMEKVYQLYLAGQLTTEGFGTRNRPLEDRLHELDHEIPRLQGEVDYLAIEHLTSEDVTSGVEDLYDRWPSLASEEKRVLVETFVEKLTISKDGISIALLYLPPTSPPPSSPELAANRQRGKGLAASGASIRR